MTRRGLFLLFTITLLSMLTGCQLSTFQRRGPAFVDVKAEQQAIMQLREQLTTLVQAKGVTFAVAGSSGPANSDEQQAQNLVRIIVDREASLITQDYAGYAKVIREGQASTNLIFDLVTLGAAGAATTTGGTEAKAVLAAIAAASTGTRVAISADVFQQDTAGAILTVCDKLRNTTLLSIQQHCRARTYWDYPLAIADNDILTLYNSGTITAASRAIAVSTAATQPSN